MRISRNSYVPVRIRNILGFTLIELMVVIAIVAILVMIAMPGYESYIRKTKRSLGKGELLAVQARQEQFFADNKQYATDLSNLGYGSSPYAINSDGVEVDVTSVDRIYLIKLSSATTTAFTLEAVPQGRQAPDPECGTFSITNTSVKSISGNSSLSNCW